MDIDFALSDLYESLRPKLVLFKSFEEAATAVDLLLEQNATATAEGKQPSLSVNLIKLLLVVDLSEGSMDLSDGESVREFKYESDDDDVEVDPPQQVRHQAAPSCCFGLIVAAE